MHKLCENENPDMHVTDCLVWKPVWNSRFVLVNGGAEILLLRWLQEAKLGTDEVGFVCCFFVVSLLILGLFVGGTPAFSHTCVSASQLGKANNERSPVTVILEWRKTSRGNIPDQSHPKERHDAWNAVSRKPNIVWTHAGNVALGSVRLEVKQGRRS